MKNMTTKIQYPGGLLLVVYFILCCTVDAWSLPSQTPLLIPPVFFMLWQKPGRGEAYHGGRNRRVDNKWLRSLHRRQKVG